MYARPETASSYACTAVTSFAYPLVDRTKASHHRGEVTTARAARVEPRRW